MAGHPADLNVPPNPCPTRRPSDLPPGPGGRRVGAVARSLAPIKSRANLRIAGIWEDLRRGMTPLPNGWAVGWNPWSKNRQSARIRHCERSEAISSYRYFGDDGWRLLRR